MRWISIIACLAPLPALSDGVTGGRSVECYCTDRNGARVEMGDTICLQVDGKMFTAQCQMSLNVPMWRKLGDGCVGASIPTAPTNPTPARG